MEDLTARQHEVLGYIQLHMREEGTWPSFREIQAHFGYQSTNAVMGHIRALERKGCISRVPGQARTFRINMDFDEEHWPENAGGVIEIPLYGSIAAGYPDGVEAGGAIGQIKIDAGTAGLRRARHCFALKVRGDSMTGAGIFDGDIVIVEQRPPRHGDIVAALIDGETTLKRFINKKGRAPCLKAENKHYPELHPVSELVIQGVAKSLVRNL